VAFLTLQNLDKNFGGLKAVRNFSVDVAQGDVLALIGPNGAGKSTLLSMIGGTLMPSRGKIIFEGSEITRYAAYQRARLGIARVFQRNALFKSMTVLENVLTGAHLRNRGGISEIFFRKRSDMQKSAEHHQQALELLGFVGLQSYSRELAVNLPHGHQRMLCIAVALASTPKLLLLDEPLTGMNAEEMAAMIKIIKSLWSQKAITVIVVEHNMKAVLGMCEHTVVLNYGEKMMEADSPKECIENAAVIEAYLGADDDVF
jgi:branched-chain amino acid transport system ATP-binding protein